MQAGKQAGGHKAAAVKLVSSSADIVSVYGLQNKSNPKPFVLFVYPSFDTMYLSESMNKKKNYCWSTSTEGSTPFLK